MLSASLVTLLFAPSALASAPSGEPVDLGAADDYSVLATGLTSNGPTAMSDNVGTSPTTALAGDTAPIVLGETHLGDAQAAAAMDSLDTAYGDAMLRPATDGLPADLAGQNFGPGVYNTGIAMGFTASTEMTLTGTSDDIFIFQIGAALSVGAGVKVNFAGGAQPCNVYWVVGGAANLGANAKFAGTVMSNTSIGVGAGGRVDGRLLSRGTATLSATAVRTACTDTIEVPGPAGPAGPTGATGPAGDAGAQGIQGETGLDGEVGSRGPDGEQGPIGPGGTAGAEGDQGIQGIQGIRGETGVQGLIGNTGVQGLIGNTGVQGLIGNTGVQGLIGETGIQGLTGTIGLSGLPGLTGLTGLTGLMGATGLTGANGLTGATGLTGAGGLTGAIGAIGTTGAAGPRGPAGTPSVPDTTTLCVTNRANRRNVRQGGLVKWTIVVKNCGARAASGVAVTDRLLKGATVKNRGGGSLIRGQLGWATGSLAPGARRIYAFTTRIRANARIGRYVNRAAADGDNADLASGEGSTTVTSGT